MAAIYAMASTRPQSHILRPSTSSTTNMPLTPAPSLLPTMSQIGPTKEWTIPPRPKPGRKPALDAPPTKRKAQNREAQRAFRERRAAKVGELEDQMKHMEDEDVKEQDDLRDRIKSLQEEVNMWRSLHEDLRRSSEILETAMNRERSARQQLELDFLILKRSIPESTDAVPLRPRRRQPNAATLEEAGKQEKAQEHEEPEDLTCGRCSNDSRCQCIEDAFKMNDIATVTVGNDDLKRPLSPQNWSDSNKCQRHNEMSDEPTEIDFTTPHPPNLPNATTSLTTSSIPALSAATESCGFCQDDTPCICAEIVRRNEREREAQLVTDPGPSFKSNQVSGACTQNPGTCAQCQSDPASKEFCLSLAESRQLIADTDSRPAASFSQTVPTLNCADAFNRLAQHPAFPQASTELTTWVPQLAAGTVPSTSNPDSSNLEGRTVFEIEAASVMNVLKLFDVRFGDIQNRK